MDTCCKKCGGELQFAGHDVMDGIECTVDLCLACGEEWLSIPYARKGGVY